MSDEPGVPTRGDIIHATLNGKLLRDIAHRLLDEVERLREQLTASERPLVRALRKENARLRERVAKLIRELALAFPGSKWADEDKATRRKHESNTDGDGTTAGG